MTSPDDVTAIRNLLTGLVSEHDADGEHRPKVGEVFAPERHSAALSHSTPLVIGARGAGKSFWAGVLGQDDTRAFVAKLYPRLGLDRLAVRFGYNGLNTGDAVGPQTVAARVPDPIEHRRAVLFWEIVILRAARAVLESPTDAPSIAALMERFGDPEERHHEWRRVDAMIESTGRKLLVMFDALDTLARDWRRMGALTDALFEASWALRARKAIRAKIFIRPEQLEDEALRFVELPKLRAGGSNLDWDQTELYGLLYARLAEAESTSHRRPFQTLAAELGGPVPEAEVDRLRDWLLATSPDAQKRMMETLAGRFMGAGPNKGATYPWAFNHLKDAKGMVTPRSFVSLFAQAARHPQSASAPPRVLTVAGIQQGLRAASKTRVDQLAMEHRWIKRALGPLAGIKVPCDSKDIHEIWRRSSTVVTILKAAETLPGFLPPFPPDTAGVPEAALEAAMVRIGVLGYRWDGRVDIPDLFRIAARMLKPGGPGGLA